MDPGITEKSPILHWVDNFHTAYVLDCFKHYAESTGDGRFDQDLKNGYEYWKSTFFLADGTPKYYSQKTLPLDIQCSSQAIDTLVFFHDRDPEALPLALKVAQWTIEQDAGPNRLLLLSPVFPWDGQQDADAALGTGDDALRAGWTLQAVVGEEAIVKKKVLIIVENSPVPFDTRVWKEALSLRESDYDVTVLCPRDKGYRQGYEELDGIHIYRHPMPEEGNSATRVSLGIRLRAVLGVFVFLVDLPAPWISRHSGLQPSRRYFPDCSAVQAARGQVYLRPSRCEPGVVLLEIREKGLLLQGPGMAGETDVPL